MVEFTCFDVVDAGALGPGDKPRRVHNLGSGAILCWADEPSRPDRRELVTVVSPTGNSRIQLQDLARDYEVDAFLISYNEDIGNDGL